VDILWCGPKLDPQVPDDAEAGNYMFAASPRFVCRQKACCLLTELEIQALIIYDE
jgi:hypothetical protein